MADAVTAINLRSLHFRRVINGRIKESTCKRTGTGYQK